MSEPPTSTRFPVHVPGALSSSGGRVSPPASLPATIVAATDVPETSTSVGPGDGAVTRSPGAGTSAERVLARASNPSSRCAALAPMTPGCAAR